jgi:cytochrome c-type biogenesis protein
MSAASWSCHRSLLRREPVSGVGQLVSTGPLLLALPVAAAAGAVTFLSPCCLPLVPGYLSYITGMAGTGTPSADESTEVSTTTSRSSGGTAVVTAVPVVVAPQPPRSRVFAATCLFVLGFSLVFAIEGLLLGGLGHLVKAHTREITQVFGVVTILLGLLFAGAFDRFTFAGRIARPSARPKAGLAGAPLLGVMFGVGWTPCTGPTLAAVMGLATTTGTAPRGAVLAFVYALGLGIPFLLVALGFHRVLRAFAFFKRHARVVTMVGGGLLVCIGLLEVTGAWTSFMSWVQVHWPISYTSPI